MEFVVCVANFVYNMYVCGRSSVSGCSGGIIVETDLLARDVDGIYVNASDCNNIYSSGPIIFCTRCRRVLGYIFDWTEGEMSPTSVLHLCEVRLLTFKPLKVHTIGDEQVYFFGAFKNTDVEFMEKSCSLTTSMLPIQLPNVTVMRVAPDFEYETMNVPSDDEPIEVEDDDEDEEWTDYLQNTNFAQEEEDWMDRYDNSDWSDDSTQSGIGLGSASPYSPGFLDLTENETISAFSWGSFTSLLTHSPAHSVDSLLLSRSEIFLRTPPMLTRTTSSLDAFDQIGEVYVPRFIDDMQLIPRYNQNFCWYEYRGTVNRGIDWPNFP